MARFAELERACAVFCEQVDARAQRAFRWTPADMLAEEHSRLHPIPQVPFTAALGVTRTADALSTPHRAMAGLRFLRLGGWLRRVRAVDGRSTLQYQGLESLSPSDDP
jgi:hypothetical protein